MPRWTERQQAADEIHNRFFAGIIAEIAGQLQEDEDWYDHHPDSSSYSDSSSSESTGMDMSGSDKSSSSSSTSSSDLSMVDSDDS
ncbi:hypothetical protein M405DRAFT_805768, partial [Rhizopogon salebrosus TDB-379]